MKIFCKFEKSQIRESNFDRVANKFSGGVKFGPKRGLISILPFHPFIQAYLQYKYKHKYKYKYKYKYKFKCN